MKIDLGLNMSQGKVHVCGCVRQQTAGGCERYMHEKKPLYKDDSNVRNGTTHFIKGEKDTYNFEQSKYYLRRTFLAFFLRNPSIASYVVGKQPCFCHTDFKL